MERFEPCIERGETKVIDSKVFEPFVIHFLPSTVSDGDIHHGCGQRVEAEDAGTAGSNRTTEAYDVQRPTHPRSQKRNGNVSMYDLRNTPVVVEREEISRTPKGQEGRRRSSAPTIEAPTPVQLILENTGGSGCPVSQRPGRLKGSRLIADHHVLRASQRSRCPEGASDSLPMTRREKKATTSQPRDT